jgi:hypothetical protein
MTSSDEGVFLHLPFTTAEALADLTGVPVQQIEERIFKGDIPILVYKGKSYLDVKQWLASVPADDFLAEIMG